MKQSVRRGVSSETFVHCICLYLECTYGWKLLFTSRRYIALHKNIALLFGSYSQKSAIVLYDVHNVMCDILYTQ